jgi:hypothetical protein
LPRTAPVLWAGHQIVDGRTRVPFLGTLQTRVETFVLAQITPTEDSLTLKQFACKTAIKKVAGVMVTIPQKALRGMPAAIVRFRRIDDAWLAPAWRVGWSSEDIDGDGHPGMSVEVKAPLCKGRLYVANQTFSSAKAWWLKDKEAMSGALRVRVQQTILGSDSLCLRLFSKDSREEQSGVFAYRRVKPGSTCDGLLQGPWPVLARGSVGEVER